MSDNAYRTRIVIEVEIEHFSTPEMIIQSIKRWLKCPAVKSVKTLKAESNFQLHDKPSTEFHAVQLNV
jgi:hypothetical protein